MGVVPPRAYIAMDAFFTQPWLLILIPVAWVVVVFVARNGVMQLSRRTLVPATALRLIAVTLVILALAGLRLPVPGGTGQYHLLA